MNKDFTGKKEKKEVSHKLALHLLVLSIEEESKEKYLAKIVTELKKRHRLKENTWQEMSERRKYPGMRSKRAKRALSLLFTEEESLSVGWVSPSYVRHCMGRFMNKYDYKNVSHYLNLLGEMIEKRYNADGHLEYKLKREAITFVEIFQGMDMHNLLPSFRRSLYYQAPFPVGLKSRQLFSQSLSNKDREETESFLEFKTGERELSFNDSHLLRLFLIEGMPHAELMGKIMKKYSMSTYAVLRMLDMILYIGETLSGQEEPDEIYLEKCMEALYYGKTKDLESIRGTK